ncbi:MAG: hypothetical protein J2P25_14415 [Nocardiopsaceae bacterium]|nr:hypothetical protein [Nocardiopsaceae bacterium]
MTLSLEILRASLPLDDPDRHALDGAADVVFARLIATAPVAGWPAARVLTGRLARLLAEIEARGGRWSTARVMAVYKRLGIDVPKRATARHDLHALYLVGRLALHNNRGNRFYTPFGGGPR